MKATALLLSLPIVAALAFVPRQDPQDPQQPAKPEQAEAPVEVVQIMPISELRYTDMQGSLQTVSSRTVVEIRLFQNVTDRIRLELTYDNGDYSLIEAQAIHVLRSGSTRDVRLVRTTNANMRFPKLP